MESNVKKLLKDSGALLEGHFLLTSGRHSNKYIEKFRLMESPEHLDRICELMSDMYKQENVDIILGAAIGGILIAGGVGKYLNKKHIFTERVDGKMEKDTPLEIIIKHFDHLINILGEDRVAIGSDFDGATIPMKIKNLSGMINLQEFLLYSGYDKNIIEKLFYKNWLNFLAKNL